MLTARQQEIWNFLVEYVDRHGYPPTVREIGEQVGLASPSTVHAHLANLERAGLLRRDPTKPRALELIGRERRAPESPAADGDRDVARLPLVGEIAAGGPLLAEQTIEEYVPMPASTKGVFLLARQGRVDARRGHPRRRPRDRAAGAGRENGEIVVALAGDDESADEATVKTFYREGRQIRLQPENASMEPIYAEHVQILGRVVGVFGSCRFLADDVTSLRARSTRSSSPCFEVRRSSALTCGELSCAHVRVSCSAGSTEARRATRTRRTRATLGHAGRVTAAPHFGGGVEGSPDTAGQDAGARPGGESRRKVEQKGDRLRRGSLRRRRGKGETVG